MKKLADLFWAPNPRFAAKRVYNEEDILRAGSLHMCLQWCLYDI